MELIAFGLGVLLLAVAFWDLFETIVVPRPTPGWFRLGRYLVRGSWRVLRSVRDGNPNRSYDRALGLFAPAATVALLVTWLAALIVGYGLLMYALRDELQPVPPDLGTAIYFAATSLLTIGFGDIVAVGAHLVEDIYNLGFHAGEPSTLDRSAFEAACARLTEAGYRLCPTDQAWALFEAARGTYATRLEAMANYWATPATSWLGDPVVLRAPLHPIDDP